MTKLVLHSSSSTTTINGETTTKNEEEGNVNTLTDNRTVVEQVKISLYFLFIYYLLLFLYR